MRGPVWCVALVVIACGGKREVGAGSGASSGSGSDDAAPALPVTPSGLPAARYDGPAIAATTWTPQVLATPKGLVAEAALGDAMDLDGDTLVVGAPGALFSDAPGAVYVYVRKAGAWGAPFALPAPTARGGFGLAVAVSGDTIVAAAHGGIVHVYQRDGVRWNPKDPITLPAQDEAHPWYSVALDLDGDTLVVGIEDWAVATTPGQGAVLVYTRSAGVWSKTAEIVAPDVDARRAMKDQPAFGWRVALHGDRLAVTSRQAKCASGIEMCGAANLFERSGAGGAWKPVVALPQGDLVRWAVLGFSLGADDQRIVLGVDGEHRAWVLEHTAGGWRDAGALGARETGGANEINWAKAVAVHGAIAARAVIARPPSGPPPTLPGTNEIDTDAMKHQRGGTPGAVIVYARAADGWTEGATLQAPDGTPGDEFGASLVIGDDVIVAGAPGAGAGKVVAFTRAK